MSQTILTDAEWNLFQRLPGPPLTAEIRTTSVCIVEWLPDGDRPTGRLLHEWMNDRRPGWSTYAACKTKVDVIRAIECATSRAEYPTAIPILHLEAHGADTGLVGPNGTGDCEMLTWEELTTPLQQLNLVTRCNLVVVVAACSGFAGIRALHRGPRAPAAAVVGPDTTVMPRNLLWGAQEFYRRWMDKRHRALEEIAASASREAGTITFEWHPFTILAFEALAELIIVSVRSDERRRRIDRMRARLRADPRLSADQIEARLAAVARLPSWIDLQRLWDRLFMIDLYPSNRERFGLDMRAVVEAIAATCGD